MQIVIAVVVMGVIGLVAVVLVAAATLIRLLPLLMLVLMVVGAVRWWERRAGRRAGPYAPAPPRSSAIPRPAAPPPPTVRYPDGWLMVPLWIDPRGRAQRRPVMDAEVISVQDHDG